MTRLKVLRDFQHIISSSDVVFCIGEFICTDASPYTEGTFFFPEVTVDTISIALGVAMATDKKVFVVLEDSCFLEHLNSMLQAAVSNCKNLYFLILVTNNYVPSVKQPTVSNALRSLKGIIFNAGVIVHEYDPYFKNKKGLAVLKSILNDSIGPVVGFVNITNRRVNNKGRYCMESIDPMIKFIRNRELGTSVKKLEKKPFDLDAIMKEK